MGKVIAGLASSHAYTFLDPTAWDERRQVTRGRYAARYGQMPRETPELSEETLEENCVRYARIREGLEYLRHQLHTLRPDSLILIGDDQDENYREDNLPQFAIYLGEEFAIGSRGGQAGPRYRCDATLAHAILEQGVEAGFDLASSHRFPDDLLMSHAHTEVLRFLDPEGRAPVVPIFVNAIHVPGPTPSRCYSLGRTLRQIVESQPDGRRVAIYASGGLSHYTSGYPWAHYRGEATVGSIDVEFDRKSVDLMAQGRGAELAKLASRDLLDTGNIEFRQWIVLQGALGGCRPQRLVYEPFFRGLMGMAVGYWDVEQSLAPVP